MIDLEEVRYKYPEVWERIRAVRSGKCKEEEDKFIKDCSLYVYKLNYPFVWERMLTVHWRRLYLRKFNQKSFSPILTEEEIIYDSYHGWRRINSRKVN